MPSVMATSSPISMVFIVRYCVIKNISEMSTTKSGRRISAHVALASDPIVQNLMVIILSEFAPIDMIKFENALNKAFTTAPESIRLVVVIFLPMDAINITMAVDITEPKNAPIPVIDLRPSIIKNVAPNVAPAEIPRIYGSEIGLFTVVCITVPQSASPAPTISPIITLGILIFHTMAIVDFDKLAAFIWNRFDCMVE